MSPREMRIYNNKVRRIRELRKNIFLFLITLCLVIALSITISGFFSKAKSKTEDTEYKYYKSVMVNTGDTLWSIANEHINENYKNMEEYVIEVKQMNNLRDDHITAGSYLIIPYFSNEFIS